MATSGTVGQTVINVDTLLQHAIRRCQRPVQELTPEIALGARENLYFFLSELANKQIPLWRTDYVTLGMTANAPYYDMPVGTVDVLNALYRTMTQITGTFVPSSTIISIDAGSETVVYTYGFSPAITGAYTLLFEYSDDGATWVTAKSIASASYTAGQWYWWDETTPFTAQYWRLRATSGDVTDASAFFSTQGFDRVLYRMNRDQYAQLPYKFGDPGLPSQFYFERLVPQPRLAVWPTPQTAEAVCLAVWRYTQIQDVGASLLNTVDVPQRWERAIMRQMAYDMACELPGVGLDLRNQLKAEADESLRLAWDQERDNSPVMWQANISHYTA